MGCYDYLRHHFSLDSANNSLASQFTLISLEVKASQPARLKPVLDVSENSLDGNGCMQLVKC